jgi:hypothetical protein
MYGPSLGLRNSQSINFHQAISPMAIMLILHSRPKSLDDVTAQDHTVTVLQRTLQASNVGESALN